MAYVDGTARELTKDGRFNRDELNLRTRLREKTKERIKLFPTSHEPRNLGGSLNVDELLNILTMKGKGLVGGKYSDSDMSESEDEMRGGCGGSSYVGGKKHKKGMGAYVGGRSYVGGKKRKPSKWNMHVKRVSKETGLKGKELFQEAKKTYKNL